jgi:hypothetical protein
MLMLDLRALEVQSFPTTVEDPVEAILPISTRGPMCTCVSCTDRPPDCTVSVDQTVEAA